MKRLFDFICTVMLLFLIALPLLLVSFLIKLTMPGPIFFVQERVGKNGKLFKLIKFRTMKVADGKSKGSFDAGDTSRITPIGNFLRKTKIDELPQLLNVIKGDMSLVGPRPEVKIWTDVYPEQWAIVHKVRPGITDEASITFRNEEIILKNSKNPIDTYRNQILPQKLALYIQYVHNQSLLGDLKILVRTIGHVLFK
ncbi:MAG: sugar transferase [Sediminibacterium sp.]